MGFRKEAHFIDVFGDLQRIVGGFLLLESDLSFTHLS